LKNLPVAANVRRYPLVTRRQLHLASLVHSADLSAQTWPLGQTCFSTMLTAKLAKMSTATNICTFMSA